MSESEDIQIKPIPVPSKDWEVKSIDIRVFYNGDVCPYIELDPNISKRYVGFESIKYDLDICMQLLASLEKEVTKDPVVLNAILEAFITKYARCFVSASEGRGIKLEENDIFREAPEMIVRSHDHLMSERHSFTAHAGASKSDIVSGRLALKPPHIGKGLVTLYTARDYVYTLGPELFCEYGALIRYVKERIDGKLEKIYKMLKEHYSKQDIDELYEKSKYVIA